MESSKSSQSFWCWAVKCMKMEINLLTSEDNSREMMNKNQCINTEPESEKKADLFQM